MSQAERVVAGRFRVLREIGRGGMATVHVARQVDLDRLVALKELRGLRGDDPSLARRFLREARLAGSLSHPNIVTVHEYFEDDGVPYIAMEYLERGSLRPYMGRLSLARIGGVLEDLLAGLAHAERHRVVHRDVKPENLLVTGEGSVKIADFGIAKATNAIEQTAHLTATGLTVGTPNYIAPEQALARELGPWTDLYSAGVTAFELFSGRTPFGDTKEPMAIVLRQINEPIRPITDLVPGVDRRLAMWVSWLVAKEPRRRPQSAAEAWDALEETLIALLGPRWRREVHLTPSSASPPPPPQPRPRDDPRLAATLLPRRRRRVKAPAPPAPRRLPPIVARAGLLVAVLAAVGALLGNRQGPAQLPPALDDSSIADLAAPAPTTTASRANLVAEAAAARQQAAGYRSAEAQVAKQPGTSAAEAESRAALLARARAYDRAAAAAERGDGAGYATALAEATAGPQTPTTPAVTAPPAVTTAPTVKARPALTAPVTTEPSSDEDASDESTSDEPTADEPASGCAGDSLSDDPSDDDC